jgi:hypothetical protein
VVRANTWTHLAAQYDGSSWMMFVDSILVDSKTYAEVPSKFPPETTQPVLFGREETTAATVQPSSDRQYHGLLYEFAKYSKPVAVNTRCGPLSERDLEEFLQVSVPRTAMAWNCLLIGVAHPTSPTPSL